MSFQVNFEDKEHFKTPSQKKKDFKMKLLMDPTAVGLFVLFVIIIAIIFGCIYIWMDEDSPLKKLPETSTATATTSS